jgi:anti-sigma factor RsiW
MKCTAAARKLSAYIDRALTLQEQHAVREHCSQCVQCGEELQRLLQMQSYMSVLKPVTVSPGFRTAFWQKVADIKAQPKPALLDRFIMKFFPIPVAGAIALLIVSGFVSVTLAKGDAGAVAGTVRQVLVCSVAQKVFSPLNYIDFCDRCCMRNGSSCCTNGADCPHKGESK